MEEQIIKYPASSEAPTSLYWRGRLYEDVEKNLPQAANFYTALSTTYRNYYYRQPGPAAADRHGHAAAGRPRTGARVGACARTTDAGRRTPRE